MTAPLGSMLVPEGVDTKRTVTNSVAREASRTTIRRSVQRARTKAHYSEALVGCAGFEPATSAM
jgi:hypothetical protein